MRLNDIINTLYDKKKSCFINTAANISAIVTGSHTEGGKVGRGPRLPKDEERVGDPEPLVLQSGLQHAESR